MCGLVIFTLLDNAGSYYPNFTAVGEATLEAHFMTNYFSHFYLTALLLGRIKEARGRIINTTSSALYTGTMISIFLYNQFSQFIDCTMRVSFRQRHFHASETTP